ncbi:CRISPR-associated endonuclease Cas2 [uncultured Thiohalocapsa sp.]|uniref:CRISPR-associated endonuclease Cas2 n=1 Tax=uncultured Thiohalocapsa sp. TaxID=768990 RepID=UPI0025D35A06|nr:CRISPR-associated endonuclease Cas2 [uncultured Thiohalocapsa sp.]
MQHRKDWFLLAYDIAEPRRLRRVHRRLRREGIAMQQSVFLLFGSETALCSLLDELAELMEPTEDDLRAYPVADPAELWLHGQSALQQGVLRDAPPPITGERSPRRPPPRPRPRRPGLWQRLLGRDPGAGARAPQ